MANDLILDVTKCIGALSANVVDLVENARLDVQSGLSPGTLNRLQCGFMAIEDDTVQRPLDVAKQAVFDRMPLRRVGRVMGDAQGQTQARAQRHKVLFETQRTGSVGTAGIECEDDFLGLRVVPMTIFHPGQCDGVANEGAGFARGAQGHETGIVEIVVDAVRHEHTLAQMTEVVVVDVLHVRAVALTAAMQITEQLLLLGVNAQHRIAARMCLSTQCVDEAELLVALVRIHMTGDKFLAQGAAAIAGLLKEFRRCVAADFVATAHQFPSQLHRLEVGPANARIGGTAGAVCLEDFLEAALQARLTTGGLWPPAARSADALGAAAGTMRMIMIVVAHRVQLVNPGIDGSPAHAQHPRDVGNPAETDLQRLDRGIAASVVLRQGAAVQPHGLFVVLVITVKLAHIVPLLKSNGAVILPSKALDINMMAYFRIIYIKLDV